MKTRRFNDKSGLTLLEVLVAMSILVVIVVLLAVVVSRMTGIWLSTQADYQRRVTGRALLQFMVRDLEMARLPLPYPEATLSNLQFMATVPSVMPTAVLNPHAFFFQAPVAVNREKGEVAEVGYFVRWDTVSEPGIARAKLCRMLVDPAEAAHYRIYQTATDGLAVDWLGATKLDEVASASAADGYRGWFADDVIALWVRCLDSRGRPITTMADGTSVSGGYGFDSRQGYREEGTERVRRSPALPASVEMVLVTVDHQTAMKISTPIVAHPTTPEDLWKDAATPGSVAHFMENLPEVVRPGARMFSTKVVLGNARN